MGCGTSDEGGGREVAIDDAELMALEAKIEGKTQYRVGDPKFLELHKQIFVLLDSTGSMNGHCAYDSVIPRITVAKDAVRHCAQMLGAANDADQREKGALHLITFNSKELGVDRGLVHAGNVEAVLQTIDCDSGTKIMDGMRTMLRLYAQKFMDRAQDTWPLLLCCIITDGELDDGLEFERHMARVHGRMFIEIAVTGFGEDHDRAVRHYQKIAARHDHVRVTQFKNGSDPRLIAQQLLSMVNPRLLVVQQQQPPAYPGVQNLWPNASVI